MLRRDPTNMDARRAAVSAAIELGDLRNAAQLVDQGLALDREDPRVWMMSADLARARGNDGRVLSDLRTAQALRRQQMGQSASSGAPDSGAARIGTGAGPVEGGNPFRRDGGGPPLIGDAESDSILPSIPAGPALPADPMGNDIARAIVVAQNAVAPSISLGAGVRARSGTTGLDKLYDVTASMDASFSPGGYGRLTVGVKPTFLSNGALPATPAQMQQFGTLALGGTAPGNQYAEGVGVSAGYKYRWIAADIGSTPIGFRTENVVGGLELSPEITDGLRLRTTTEQRAVTDSLLSYAGTMDPGTGRTFGGVVRTRGHAQLEFSAGPANFYAGGGYARLTGENVKTNSETEAGIGGSYPVYRTAEGELRLGLDLVYFSYANNLSFFTFGQGGYFSPQSYAAAVIPIEYSEKRENLTWTVGGSVGAQNYSQSSSPVFPNNNDLQVRLAALAANDPTLVTSYPSKTQSGVVGAHGSIDYQVTPSLRIGGSIRFDRTGNWNETQALLYGRYIFNGMQ